MDESSSPLPPLPASSGNEPAGDEIPLASVVQPQGAEAPFANVVPQPFAYSTSLAQRPGLVTAIGVLAIVVACMSALVSVVSGGETFMFYTFSKIFARMGNMNANITQNPVTPTVQTGPLSVADSGIVTDILRERLALEGPRLRELAELLHKHGTAIFQTDDNSAMTAVSVRAAITDAHSAGSDSASAAKFSTAAGTVEIYPDHATFASTDGATTIRTSAQDQSDNVSSNVSTTMPGSALQAGEISRALAAIRQMPGVTVNPAQMASIRRELSNPNQTLVVSGGTTLVNYATNLPANEVQISFSSGTLTVDAAGKVISSATTAMPMNMNLSVPGTWAGLVVGECAASAFLAIYLFVVGIFVLRGSLSSPRMLRIYAYLKIVLAITAAVGVGVLFTQSTFGAGMFGNQMAGSMFGIGVLAAGIAYPIGVLIALRTSAVRHYFSPPEGTQT